MMKIDNGIILTGGTGSRLAPQTFFFNKHLLNIGNKFIIDYPLKTLSEIGVKNLTVVLGGPHFAQIVSYLKDGKNFDMNINYVYQEEPKGIAQAINLCKNFVTNKFITILGDNIFSKPLFFDTTKSAQIALYNHPELNRFGVASYSLSGELLSIIEKPKRLPKKANNYAITGCYLFDNKFFDYFNKLVISDRGEYEITDIIKMYAKNDDLDQIYVDGIWSDAGTHESLNFLNHTL